MKNAFWIMLLTVLTFIAIAGFYINRESWFGWIQKERILNANTEFIKCDNGTYIIKTFVTNKETIIDSTFISDDSILIGYKEAQNITTGEYNTAIGYGESEPRPRGVIFPCDMFIGGRCPYKPGDSVYCEFCKEYHIIPEWYGK